MGTLAELGLLAMEGCGDKGFVLVTVPFHLQLTTGEDLCGSLRVGVDDDDGVGCLDEDEVRTRFKLAAAVHMRTPEEREH